MPALLLFIIYLGVALILSALLYFPVFQLLDALWEVRPDRVYHRLFMVIAILGFWPFLQLLGINNRNALGYSLEYRHFLQTLARGLLIGLMILIVLAILLVLSGARVPVPGEILPGDLLYAMLTGLLAGILIALIEETFFRGALQYGMRRSSSFVTTAVCTALLYAAVHFLHPPALSEGTIVDWNSGWQMLMGMFHSYKDIAVIADSLIALFIAGLFLSMVRERTGNIALCIGIHAGWVLTIKMTKEVTSLATDSPAVFLVGSYDNIIGWAAAAVLAVMTLWYWRFAK